MSCKYCGAETRYIREDSKSLQLENNKPHYCTLYDLLTSFSMMERNVLEIEHPPLRAFRQLSIYFNNEQKEEIYKALHTSKKLKYKYWISWLNIAITRMDKTEYRDYVRKVNLINVPERTY